MRRVIAFFAIGLVLLAALNWLARLPGGDAREREMRARLTAISGHEAVSLGASTANGFDLSPLCLDALQYHLTQDVFEMAAVVDFTLSRPKPPRLWFAILAPTIQSFDNGSPGAGWPGQREASYRALYSDGYRGLIGGDWRHALTANLMPAMGDEAWRPHMRWLLGALGYGVDRGTPNDVVMRMTVDPRRAEALGDEFARSRAAVLRRIAYYSPGVPSRAADALLGMGEKIRRSGGQLVVIVPPMTRAAHQAAERHMPGELRGFQTLLGRLSAAGVAVRDHWRDPRFDGRYDLFHDTQHLNARGAALFSHIAAEELRGPLRIQTGCR
jgi:hypothetical protein